VAKISKRLETQIVLSKLVEFFFSTQCVFSSLVFKL